MSALRQLFAIIDGPNAADCVGLLDADLRFSVVFSIGPHGAQDVAGDHPAFDDYLAERGAPTWTHHVRAESAHRVEGHDLGETRQDGATVAWFVAALRLTPEGLIDRYIVGRSPAVLFELG